MLTTENDTFSEEYDIVCSFPKQKNDCYYKKAQIKDTMKAYFCHRHTLLQATTLSRLFHLF